MATVKGYVYIYMSEGERKRWEEESRGDGGGKKERIGRHYTRKGEVVGSWVEPYPYRPR